MRCFVMCPVRSEPHSQLNAVPDRAIYRAFIVGTSCRMLLHAQRSSGKLRKEPVWKVMVLSGVGGKSVVQPRDRGSVEMAVNVRGVVVAGATDIRTGSGGATRNRTMLACGEHLAFEPG